MQPMVCNVNFALCNTAYVTAHNATFQIPDGEGGKQAECAGVRMEARRDKTNALRVGLVYDSHPRPGARPKPWSLN
jgi:hypothetical protein